MRKMFGAFLLFFPAILFGQQTIFEVPSADVSGRGEGFYQHQTVARTWGGDRRWIRPNAAGNSNASFGFKWSPRLNDPESAVPLRFVAGKMAQARVNGPRAGNWTYLMLNAELPRPGTPPLNDAGRLVFRKA